MWNEVWHASTVSSVHAGRLLQCPTCSLVPGDGSETCVTQTHWFSLFLPYCNSHVDGNNFTDLFHAEVREILCEWTVTCYVIVLWGRPNPSWSLLMKCGMYPMPLMSSGFSHEVSTAIFTLCQAWFLFPRKLSSQNS